MSKLNSLNTHGIKFHFLVSWGSGTAGGQCFWAIKETNNLWKGISPFRIAYYGWFWNTVYCRKHFSPRYDPCSLEPQLTDEESLLLMAHILRHHNTKEATESLVTLLQFHLPQETLLSAKKYLFEKHFRKQRLSKPTSAARRALHTLLWVELTSLIVSVEQHTLQNSGYVKAFTF